MTKLKMLEDIEQSELIQDGKKVTQDDDGNWIPASAEWISVKKVYSFDLREVVKEWITEIDEITDNYVENGGDLSDDEVMTIFKEKHPEWYPQLIDDWSNDDLSRFYFLQDFLRYFLNLEEKK